MLARCWHRELDLGVHDAFHLVLAEVCGATLVTTDRRLAAAARDAALLV